MSPRTLPTTLLALASGLALAACERTRPLDQAPAPQVTLHGVRLRYFQADRLVAQGRAAQVTYERSSGEVGASEAVLRFPSRRPSGGTEVRAARLEGSLATRQADGKDGVVIQAGGRLVARTERAHLDGQALEVTGAEPVMIEGPSLRLHAGGFHLWLQDERLELAGEVRGHLGEAP